MTVVGRAPETPRGRGMPPPDAAPVSAIDAARRPHQVAGRADADAVGGSPADDASATDLLQPPPAQRPARLTRRHTSARLDTPLTKVSADAFKGALAAVGP